MKYTKLILTSLIVSIVSVATLATGIVSADAKQAVCEGAGLVANTNSCDPQAGTATVDSTIKKALNLFSGIVGLVAVIMLIVGGLKMVTSSGDANAVTSARNTIIYAAIGLVIVALSQFIVKFVINKVTL